VAEATKARVLDEQARLLALSLLRDRPGKLRFIVDPEISWKVAMEMAKEQLSKPRRPLGDSI
jgi:hypothetical protein